MKSRSKKVSINEEIEASEVRLVDAEGNQAGIVAIDEALAAAKAARLDLVEIVPDSIPPVCKIMDYGKKVFDEKKQQVLNRKKQRQTQVKEIKFRPGTEEGDYQVKLRNLIRFLENGDKAKVTCRFRGREMAHQDIGMKLMSRVRDDLAEYGTVELHPKPEGRQIIMVLSPTKKKQ